MVCQPKKTTYNQYLNYSLNLNLKPMQKFEFDVKIPASSNEEARQKITAILQLSNLFTTKELQGMVQYVQKNPFKVTLFKKSLGL